MRSWPSQNASASTHTRSPTVRLTGKRPLSTAGLTDSMHTRGQAAALAARTRIRGAVSTWRAGTARYVRTWPGSSDSNAAPDSSCCLSSSISASASPSSRNRSVAGTGTT